MRTALKIQIIQSGQSQRVIARAAAIPECRLSSIVHGWVNPRDDERSALARVLGIDVLEVGADVVQA